MVHTLAPPRLATRSSQRLLHISFCAYRQYFSADCRQCETWRLLGWYRHAQLWRFRANEETRPYLSCAHQHSQYRAAYVEQLLHADSFSSIERRTWSGTCSEYVAGHWNYKLSESSIYKMASNLLLVSTRIELVAFAPLVSKYIIFFLISLYRQRFWLMIYLRYNSAVFGVTTGRDYNIYFINASDTSNVNALAVFRTNLTNSEWGSLYDTQYVPDAGDLYLIVDKFGLGVTLDPSSSSPSWSYRLAAEFQTSTDTLIPGPVAPKTSEISVDVTLSAEFMTYTTRQPSSTLSFNVEAYNDSTMPKFTWPGHALISASTDHTWKTGISVDHRGWLSTASPRKLNQSIGNTTLHVSYGLSTYVPESSSIQVAQVFMVIVIVCNIFKTVAIFFTLRNSSSRQILTLGDAVSSYLKSPDVSTLGACILGKKKLVKNISHGEKFKPAQWRRRRAHYLLGVISNGWITYSVLWVFQRCQMAFRQKVIWLLL